MGKGYDPARTWLLVKAAEGAGMMDIWRSPHEGADIESMIVQGGWQKNVIERESGLSSGTVWRVCNGDCKASEPVRGVLAGSLGKDAAELKRYDVESAPARYVCTRSLVACGLFALNRAADGKLVLAPAFPAAAMLMTAAHSDGIADAMSRLPGEAAACKRAFREVVPKLRLKEAIEGFRNSLREQSKPSNDAALAQVFGVSIGSLWLYSNGKQCPRIARYVEMAAKAHIDRLSWVFYEILSVNEAVSAYIQLEEASCAAGCGKETLCHSA